MAADLDVRLDYQTWDRLMANLNGEPTEYWGRMDPAPCYIHKTVRLRSYATKYLDLAKHKDVLDVYCDGANGSAQIRAFCWAC